jgi:hypothetical protein
LVAQTGEREKDRTAFLSKNHDAAVRLRIACWSPIQRAAPVF